MSTVNPDRSMEQALALVRGELSPFRRRLYGGVLLVTSLWTAALASLWLTEPQPLPMRLHVAFGAMIAVGSGWTAVLVWILVRRRCPTALDRLATAWMATIACVVSLVLSVGIALLRGNLAAIAGVLVTGLVLLAGALLLLRSALRLRRKLVAQLHEPVG